jgi:palmitoyltransferase ZDHHC9/14/18
LEKDFFPNLYTWLTLVGISIIYLVILGPTIYFSSFSFVIFLNAILFFLSCLMLILTGFTDPGIIPRREIWEADGGEVPAALLPPKKSELIDYLK